MFEFLRMYCAVGLYLAPFIYMLVKFDPPWLSEEKRQKRIDARRNLAALTGDPTHLVPIALYILIWPYTVSAFISILFQRFVFGKKQ